MTMGLLFAACSGGDDAAAPKRTTTTATEPTTTTTTEAPTTTTTPTTAAPKPVEVKDRKCAVAPNAGVQSRPDDWAKYWATEPDSNQPLTLQICVDDISPKVGQLVRLTVIADDPDAVVLDGNCDIFVWWIGPNPGTLCRDAVAIRNPPPPPPAKEHGHQQKTYTHSYTKAQTYLLEVDVASGPGSSEPNPYDNYATATLDILVHV